MPQNFDATVTTTPTPLTELASPAFANTPVLAREVLMQADAGNTEDILWGDDATQNIAIGAGEERIIPVNIIDEIVVKVSTGTESLHCSWIR